MKNSLKYKKDEMKRKMSSSFTGMDRYDGEKVTLRERFIDLLDDTRYFFTKTYTKSSVNDLLSDSLKNQELYKDEQEENRIRLERLNITNSNSAGLSMSVEDLLAGKDIEPSPEELVKYEKYLQGFENDSYEEEIEEDENRYRVNSEIVSNALNTARLQGSPETAQQDRFFASSCVAEGHNFCHIVSCSCNCHIYRVYRDEVSYPLNYVGYSIYRTFENTFENKSSQDFETVKNEAKKFLQTFLIQHQIGYEIDHITDAVESVSHMVTVDKTWNPDKFSETLS